MKEKHQIFLAGLMGVTAICVFLLFQREGLGGQVNPIGWVLLATVVYTEVMQMFYDDQITMSLTSPILMLAVKTQPYFFVVLLVLVSTVAGKFIQTYYYREQEKVWDIKLIFNVTQYMLIASSVRLLFTNTPSDTIGGLLYWAAAALIYIMLNMFFTGAMITLYQGCNGFLAYKSKSAAVFVYLHTMITLLLVFAYGLGGVLGCLLVLMVLIPMQGEILQRTSIHKLNPLLIQDELTGAFNRSFLKRKVTEWLHHREEFALLFMDLDDFKAINDTYGHIVGDEVLIHFVEEIRKDLRKVDRIFRFGGDEFCVLFQNLKDAEMVQERWKDEWLKFDSADGRTIAYTFSSGVVAYRDEEELNYYELLDKVDRLMYLEKKKKGSRQGVEIS